MKALLARLIRGDSLTASQAEEIFSQIMTGHAEPTQVAALLTLLAVRQPTVEELIGAATVMRRHVVPIVAPPGVIDTCGTGGVSSPIFNVSTTAAIVAASCGVPVVKHGNRSVTSKSGSFDVLRVLGVNVEAGPELQAACLKEAGICFAFAQKHHPAMKHVAAIRQSLGFATIFNLVGPLTNPAGRCRQLIGVGSPALAEKILAALIQLGSQRAMVVAGTDPDIGPLGELSISGVTHVSLFDGQQPKKIRITPEDVGLQTHSIHELEINSPEESARKVRQVLNGEKGAARDIVLLNAGAALWVADAVDNIQEGVEQVAQAIDTHAATETLEKLAKASHGHPPRNTF